jgi:ABC-type glycerol-3-phosphate transport system permease component
MDYISLNFFIYLCRWILSAFVMMIPMYFLVKYRVFEGKYQEYIHLIVVQIIGAFIFYKIDYYIFN